MTLNDDCLNHVQWLICETQGNIFEYIADNGYDMQIFVEKYMQSDFTARNMDTRYSRYQLHDPEESLDFVFKEIGEIPKADGYFIGSIAYWMGYIYRALYIVTGISSKELVHKLPFSQMIKMYPGYHTMDEIMQLERMIEWLQSNT
jgi:hypothetical protein